MLKTTSNISRNLLSTFENIKFGNEFKRISAPAAVHSVEAPYMKGAILRIHEDGPWLPVFNKDPGSLLN